MGSVANDKFGYTYFADSAGTIWFNRKACTATTARIGDLTVSTQTANWHSHREFRAQMTATITASGSGACKR